MIPLGTLGSSLYVPPAPTLTIAGMAPQGRYRADTITGLSDNAVLTTWPDSSGNGYHGTNTSSNALYRVSQTPTGLPVIRFRGTGFVTSANGSASTQTIAAVVRVINTSSHRTIVGCNGTAAGLQIRVENSSNKIVVNKSHWSNVAGSTGSIAVNTFSLVIFTYTVGGAWKIRLNGAADSSGTSGESFVGSTRFIGKDQVDNFDGDIAELVTWERVLSDAEIAAAEAELNTRWILAA